MNILGLTANFEDALNRAGSGKFQIRHWALNAFIIASALLEMIDSAFVLPAAACDLELSDSWRGFLTSMPNIGIAITSPFWGRFADKYGRKPALTISCAVAGLVGSLTAFMPNITMYAVCKFVLSLFLSPPSALTFAYCGELMTLRRRDLAIVMLSCFLSTSSVLTPILSWAILPHHWQLHLGFVNFRPWRLLTLVNAVPLLICAVLVGNWVESPKWLLIKNNPEEALDILAYVYSKNKGKPKEAFAVTSLKSDTPMANDAQQDNSIWALARPPHFKWMTLCCFLMFSVYCALNGIFLFAADTVNKLMTDEKFTGTICDLKNQPAPEVHEESCIDEISTSTFKIMVITTFIYMIIATSISLTPMPKKCLIVIGFLITAMASLLCVLVANKLVGSMAMSGLQMTCMGIGPLSAYTVELFPTYLVGTAVSVVLMFGRIGAVIGANVSASTLVSACSTTFYFYFVMMAGSAVLTLLLPKSKPVPPIPSRPVHSAIVSRLPSMVLDPLDKLERMLPQRSDSKSSEKKEPKSPQSIPQRSDSKSSEKKEPKE